MENIASIILWHEKTFPKATLAGQREKWQAERAEFSDAITKNDPAEYLLELADLFIVACGIARFDSVQALQYFGIIGDTLKTFFITNSALTIAVKDKMDINRKRDWNFANGQYQHKQ